MKSFQFEDLSKDQLIFLAKTSTTCLVAADDILRAILDGRMDDLSKLVTHYDGKLKTFRAEMVKMTFGFKTNLN